MGSLAFIFIPPVSSRTALGLPPKGVLDGPLVLTSNADTLFVCPSPSLIGSVDIWYRLTGKLEKGGFLNPAYLPWPPAAFREVNSL